MTKLIDETFAKQILSDLDLIIETLKDVQGTPKVEKKEPCHPKNHPLMNIYDKNGNLKSWCEKCGNYYEEKKEQRKLWEVIRDVPASWLGEETYKDESKAAIDAVTQCYEEWVKDFVHKCNGKDNARSFPEYLKEKLL